MGGIHIPADGLPRDYELLRADGGGDASRRHCRPLLGIILVLLYNNIIFLGLFGYNMCKKCGAIGELLCECEEEAIEDE
jgi:hypothetical protein